MVQRFEFPRDEHAPAAARRAVDELESVLDSSTVADVRLLVSELVSNSVTHGDGEKVVLLIDGGAPGSLRCEVIDDGTGFVPRGRRDRTIGGWGLELVEELASDWGVHEGSTHVWFELPARSAAGEPGLAAGSGAAGAVA